CLRLVSGAKPRTPKGSSRTAQGASPGFKVQIAESPERAAQGVRSQLQINARHKARLWYRDPLHRPFGASVVTVLVPRACALGFPESPLRGKFAPRNCLVLFVGHKVTKPARFFSLPGRPLPRTYRAPTVPPLKAGAIKGCVPL